jgi:hypothetical protein
LPCRKNSRAVAKGKIPRPPANRRMLFFSPRGTMGIVLPIREVAMRSLLLLAVAVAGCGPSVVASPPASKLPKPDAVKAAAAVPAWPDVSEWSGDPLPPGTTPKGWIINITSPGGGFLNRYALSRDPATPNSTPGGSNGPVSPSISINCSPTYSEVTASAGGFNWNAFARGSAPGGISFTATGTVVEQGQPPRPFTAVVTAIP